MNSQVGGGKLSIEAVDTVVPENLSCYKKRAEQQCKLFAFPHKYKRLTLMTAANERQEQRMHLTSSRDGVHLPH